MIVPPMVEAAAFLAPLGRFVPSSNTKEAPNFNGTGTVRKIGRLRLQMVWMVVDGGSML